MFLLIYKEAEVARTTAWNHRYILYSNINNLFKLKPIQIAFGHAIIMWLHISKI